jgi:glutathione S-transferase
MRVYGASLSPFVRKVLLALETKGIAYEMVPVLPGRLPPNYEEISPLKKMPVLDHDGFTVPDSSVICAYLDEVFPEHPLFPADPRTRARARFLEEYADTRLTETAAPFFAERFVKPRFFGAAPDEARLASLAGSDLPPVLGYLDNVVPANGFLFAAGAPGVADFSIVSPLINARYVGYEIDADRYPRLAAFFARVAALPLVARRLEHERADLEALARSDAA